MQSGKVLVDGLGVGDVGSIVLRDRKHLAEDGLIVAVMTIDSATGDIIAGPDIVSRGLYMLKSLKRFLTTLARWRSTRWTSAMHPVQETGTA